VKGVVLAGGLGSRLRPLTAVTNKHLLPVYDQPMIYYPIQTLVNAGITDIMVVTGGNSAGDFLKLLGNGKAFGLKHINYTYQEGEGGIAEALSLVEHFGGGDPVCVVLGSRPRLPTSGKGCQDHLKESSRSAPLWGSGT
jgi:glucose-1-phosphate thymidylyltransferase